MLIVALAANTCRGVSILSIVLPCLLVYDFDRGEVVHDFVVRPFSVWLRESVSGLVFYAGAVDYITVKFGKLKTPSRRHASCISEVGSLLE